MEAPFCRATVFSTVVPLSDSSGVTCIVCHTMRFLDMPTSSGNSITSSFSNSLSSWKFCSKVLPKPNPGSRMMSF